MQNYNFLRIYSKKKPFLLVFKTKRMTAHHKNGTKLLYNNKKRVVEMTINNPSYKTHKFNLIIGTLVF